MVMDRNKLLFWINILMFIDLIIVAISGFAGLSFHSQAAVFLILLLIIHLILNWAWVKGMLRNIFR